LRTEAAASSAFVRVITTSAAPVTGPTIFHIATQLLPFTVLQILPIFTGVSPVLVTDDTVLVELNIVITIMANLSAPVGLKLANVKVVTPLPEV